MSPFLAELVGTMLLVLLGDGVVANVILNKTKGQNSGWIVITVGWAAAVTIAVYAVNAISGAHLNPAVTIAMAVIGKFPWADVPAYIAAQVIGGVIGGALVWLAYLPHWAVTPDRGVKLGVFCTAPAIRQPVANVMTEIIGTAMLTLGLLAALTPANLVQKSTVAVEHFAIIKHDLGAGLAPNTHPQFAGDVLTKVDDGFTLCGFEYRHRCEF